MAEIKNVDVARIYVNFSTVHRMQCVCESELGEIDPRDTVTDTVDKVKIRIQPMGKSCSAPDSGTR